MTFELIDKDNFLQIEPMKLMFPDSQSEHDRNMISTRICIKAGQFRAEFYAEIMTVDFETFKQQLRLLYNNLKGIAVFDCLEHYITIKVQGDGLGHFECDCRAIDTPGIYETELIFKLSFDQTQIKELTNQLNVITNEYPIIGAFNIKNE